MKKSAIIIIAVVAVLGIWFISTYNRLVNKDEACNAQWSKVETQYQRRMDLIPNLVNTVKGYAAHESSTLTQVVEARNKAVSTDKSNVKDYEKAQQNLTSSLQALNVVVERYPELKANENFKELQSQLEGTENRISVERSRYAEEVQKYNKSIKKFPTVMIASMMGFSAKEYYAADKGAESAPKVSFE